MRLIHYMNENNTLDEIRNILKTKCKKFLREFLPEFNGVYYMWSGRNISGYYDVRQVRKNRKPMSTPVKVQDRVDDMFEDEFGYRPRSNSIFVTGYRKEASTYGNVNMIFPLYDYKYLWNPKIKDFFISVNYDQMQENELRRLIKSYRDDNLKEALSSKVEIMLTCKEYLVVSEELEQEIYNLLINW